MKHLLLLLCTLLPLSALDIPDPRDQHYDFAHKTLVKAMAGKGFLEAPQKKKTLYLKKLWKEAGKTARNGKKVSSTGLKFEVFDLENKDQVAVIVLPKPKVTAEARMVGARFLKRTINDIVDTLEQGFEGRDMIGGWNQGSHLNFRGATAKSAEDFRNLIVKQSK